MSPLTRKALAAMEDAVSKVIEEHRRDDRPLAVWQDGKVVLQNPWEAETAGERKERKAKRTRE